MPVIKLTLSVTFFGDIMGTDDYNDEWSKGETGPIVKAALVAAKDAATKERDSQAQAFSDAWNEGEKEPTTVEEK